LEGARVKRFEYWVTRERWKGGFAAYKRGVANHYLPSSSTLPEYFGLSADFMGKMLDLSRTRAVELKQIAVRCGYMECNHRYQEYATIDCPDHASRRLIGYADPDITHKLRIYPGRIGGKEVIKVMEQLHDEVIPKLVFANLKMRKPPLPYGFKTRLFHAVNSPALTQELNKHLSPINHCQ